MKKIKLKLPFHEKLQKTAFGLQLLMGSSYENVKSRIVINVLHPERTFNV
jgi:hypothetical protein